MKLKIAVGYDRIKQKEVETEINLDQQQVRQIVTEHIEAMDYDARKKWVEEISR